MDEYTQGRRLESKPSCLVVGQPAGSMVLAGQTHDTAADFIDGVAGASPIVPCGWTGLLPFDPRPVVFAHSAEVWAPI